MPRAGAIIFSDLIGKLDVLRVACDKRSRAGFHRLNRLMHNRVMKRRSTCCKYVICRAVGRPQGADCCF